MDIGGDNAGSDFEPGKAADVHIFADGGDLVGLFLGHGAAAAREGRRPERLHVGRRLLQHRLGHPGGELLKRLVFGDEIGLGVDFDQHPAVAFAGAGDHPFGGHPAGFLGGRGEALLAQDVDRRVHVCRRLR